MLQQAMKLLLPRAVLPAALLVIMSAPAASAADLPAAPSTLNSVFSGAQAGDVIVLAPGDYGSFRGGSKAGMVTLRPAADAAVTMSARFTPASNITLQGMTLTGLDIIGSSKNLVIRSNRFTGQADLNMSNNSNAGIVLEGNSFDGISVCGNCPEGRLQISANPRGSTPVGVTVRYNHFGGGGESDGIQIGARGAVIGPGNVFEGIKQGGYDRHVDAIQLYGQEATTIIGNYFRDNTAALMAPDGGNGEVVVHNVFDSPNSTNAVQMGSFKNATFAHNTVIGTAVAVGSKGGESASSDFVLRDNVLTSGARLRTTDGSGCDNCTIDHNLFSSGGASGSNAIVAKPSFQGGASPTTYSGWQLAAGSPGKGSASDGKDRGIDPSAFDSPPPRPPGGSTSPGTRKKGPPAKLWVQKRIKLAKLRHGLRLRVWSPVQVRVAVRLWRKGARHSFVRFTGNRMHKGTRRLVLRPHRVRFKGHKKIVVLRLRVAVTGKSGATTVLHRKIKVVR